MENGSWVVLSCFSVRSFFFGTIFVFIVWETHRIDDEMRDDDKKKGVAVVVLLVLSSVLLFGNGIGNNGQNKQHA